MKPKSIGRTLGIGFRVAGRVAGKRIAAGTRAAANAPTQQPSAEAVAQSRAKGKAAGQVTRGVARGVGGFLRPFRRVGGILWLQVTGVFFFLPVVVFAPLLWRTRASYAQGPDHRTFLITAGVMVVFLYLSVTSFWRARRK
jgi:hypothetical protein